MATLLSGKNLLKFVAVKKLQLLPPEMRDWYFPFDWNLEKLWALDLPSETRNISELRWHFDIPVWASAKGRHFDLCPREVLKHPGRYQHHDSTIESVEISYPIEVMYTVDRFAILDGMHRLASYEKQGVSEVKVRVIPREMIPLLEEDWR